MKLNLKIFIAYAIMTALILLLTAIATFNLTSNLAQKNFDDKYNKILNLLATNITQAELTAEKYATSILNSFYFIDKTEGLKDKSRYHDLLKEFGVDQVVIANKEGEFIIDTKIDPSEYDLNLFNFCDEYRDLLNKAKNLQITPIILSSPPKPQPIKYAMMSNYDTSRILEVGIHVDTIFDSLKYLMKDDSSIAKINLLSPSGTELMSISNQESITKRYYSKKIYLEKDNCCECKNKKLTADDMSRYYYYTLELFVDDDELSIAIASTKNTILYSIVLAFLFFVVISWFASIKLTSRLNNLITKLKQNIFFNDETVNNKFNKDEVDEILLEFIKLSKASQSINNEMSESKKIIANLNIVKQFSHDIQSPITLFKTLADSKKPISKHDQSNLLHLAIGRIEEVCKSLLDKTKSGSELTLSNHDLTLNIQQIVEEKKYILTSYDKKEISISFNNELLTGSKVKLNPIMLKRIVSNMINNSIEAIQSSGTISIHLTNDTAFLLIKIKDDGLGISPDNLKYIFKENYSTKTSNSGIGLYHAYEYIKSLNGSIKVESEEGAFTIMTITIPLVRENIIANHAQ